MVYLIEEINRQSIFFLGVVQLQFGDMLERSTIGAQFDVL